MNRFRISFKMLILLSLQFGAGQTAVSGNKMKVSELYNSFKDKVSQPSPDEGSPEHLIEVVHVALNKVYDGNQDVLTELNTIFEEFKSGMPTSH